MNRFQRDFNPRGRYISRYGSAECRREIYRGAVEFHEEFMATSTSSTSYLIDTDIPSIHMSLF